MRVCAHAYARIRTHTYAPYKVGVVLSRTKQFLERGWLSPNAKSAKHDVATTPAQARATPQSSFAKPVHRHSQGKPQITADFSRLGGVLPHAGQRRETRIARMLTDCGAAGAAF